MERPCGREELRPDLELGDHAVLPGLDEADTEVADQTYVPTLHGPEGT
jgi:hypothetical protein